MSLGLEAFASALSGGVSASLAKLIVYPLDFFKLRLSVRAADESVHSILAKTLREHGVFGVYLGVGPRVVRTGTQKLLYFYCYELLLRLYKLAFPAKPIGVGMNLVIGFLGDTLCLPAVVPLELISMRQSEGETITEVVRNVHAKSGWVGFFQGWTGYI